MKRQSRHLTNRHTGRYDFVSLCNSAVNNEELPAYLNGVTGDRHILILALLYNFIIFVLHLFPW